LVAGKVEYDKFSSRGDSYFEQQEGAVLAIESTRLSNRYAGASPPIGIEL